MNACLFSAWISRIKEGQVVDDCVSLIICGGEVEEARARFEDWLVGDGSEAVKVERVQSTPFVDRLFTEAGPVALDWKAIATQMKAGDEAVFDDQAQGYWVDVNQVIAPGTLAPDLEVLRTELPEDVRESINWSPDREFYFLLSALSPKTRQQPRPEVVETGDPALDEQNNLAATAELGWLNLRERDTRFAEMAEKKVVVLLQARNSVVATWLWLRYAALQKLPASELRVDPLFCILEPEEAGAGS